MARPVLLVIGFPPPVEEKVRKIAEIIGHDPDELLALAGRVASD